MQWYKFFVAMLTELSISYIGYDDPLYEYMLFGLVFFAGGLLLEMGIKLVEWYRMDTVSKRAKSYAHLASFLGFNLAMLLRNVLIFRLEIESNIANLNAYYYNINDSDFLLWGFAGSLSGSVVSCFLLVALSLIHKESK